jgi:hypothetical protein
MKLFYRGHNYNAHTAPVQTDDTTVTGTYRGAKVNYQVHQKRVSHPANLTYRGARYGG